MPTSRVRGRAILVFATILLAGAVALFEFSSGGVSSGLTSADGLSKMARRAFMTKAELNGNEKEALFETYKVPSTSKTLTDGGDIDYDDGSPGDNDDVRWTLTCSSGSPVLTFDSFDMEGNFDFVINVYDSRGVHDSTLIAKLDGKKTVSTMPIRIEGSGSDLLLQYASGGSTSKDGFHASFTCCTRQTREGNVKQYVKIDEKSLGKGSSLATELDRLNSLHTEVRACDHPR